MINAKLGGEIKAYLEFKVQGKLRRPLPETYNINMLESLSFGAKATAHVLWLVQ
jgi:hypothetical protein